MLYARCSPDKLPLYESRPKPSVRFLLVVNGHLAVVEPLRSGSGDCDPIAMASEWKFKFIDSTDASWRVWRACRCRLVPPGWDQAVQELLAVRTQAPQHSSFALHLAWAYEAHGQSDRGSDATAGGQETRPEIPGARSARAHRLRATPKGTESQQIRSPRGSPRSYYSSTDSPLIRPRFGTGEGHAAAEKGGQSPPSSINAEHRLLFLRPTP
jgi:hypothetical protein